MLKELREIEEIDALSTSNITSLFKFIDLIQTTINRLAASIKDVVWILDFDATKHVFENRNLFTNFTHDDSQIVQTASDKNLTIERTKDVIISLSNQSTLILIDVLFVSDLIVNLISTSRLWHKRIIVSFSSMKLASLRYDSQLVAHADNVNDQFLLRNEVVLAMHMNNSQSCFKMSKKTTHIEIWHRRLVHLRYRNVVANAKKVANMKEVHDSFSKKLCETCLKAKQQSESTRHLMSKTTEFLNEIHVNIEDSLFLTFRDHRFFLLIKNDVFDMFFVYVLKTKEKIIARLKKFRIWIETQSQKKIKRIQSNDELRSHQFDVWFKKTDIQWESSTLYTSEQNEVIEKNMYTIVESIRAVHKSFDLSIDLWDATIESIVHIWNRIVTSTISRKIISFEIVNNVQSDVSHLRVLECRFYMHVSKIFMRHKLDDRSWKRILVEYDETNQWKIYNLKTKRIHLSRDVRFDEKHRRYFRSKCSYRYCEIV